MKRAVTTVIGGAIALASVGCGDSNDTCTNTYSYGVDGNSYETTCANPQESDPAERARIEAGLGESEADRTLATLDAGDCVNVYEIGLDGETFERKCNNSEASIPRSPIGQLPQTLLLGDCTVADSSHTVSTLRPLTPPFTDAFARVNEMFSGDGADVRFALRGDTVRNRQATNDVIRHELGTDDDPKRAGVTVCQQLDGGTDQVRCSVTVFFENIQGMAADIGVDPNEMAAVTALHEFGHTFCLDHFNVDSSASVTAMNSKHLSDATRAQTDYFKFLGSERDQVRSIVRNPD